ncbi:hypothetical protein TEA_016566 [Camellia sinensis var. sinensis]|uniref:DNA-directed RNA polymerase subunit n=1 Tax=Camellia sinensis var. sinensis TaxID=542762 RepID=A0A4S4D8A2_CAMSN|nr:hypothetical protein TEA_016566 [Camellia sinensis var. sinensis]
MQYVHLGVVQVRFQVLHRTEQGNMAVLVLSLVPEYVMSRVVLVFFETHLVFFAGMAYRGGSGQYGGSSRSQPNRRTYPAMQREERIRLSLSCITFKLHRGEILEGVVHKILKHGVLLRCGPVENIYLSNQKMCDYQYVPGENPIFMNDKMSRIEKEVAVRFIVIGTKYIEAEKDFQAVVSLEGDFLRPIGPVS